MKRFWLLVLCLVFPTFISATELPLPNGWRIPNESDFKHLWSNDRKENPTPFRVEADFNGDGTIDEAWMLFRNDNLKWGLFVFLKSEKGYQVIKLKEVDMKDTPQYWQLVLKKAGEVRNGSPLRNAAFELWHTDTDESTLYHWDSKTKLFKSVDVES